MGDSKEGGGTWDVEAYYFVGWICVVLIFTDGVDCSFFNFFNFSFISHNDQYFRDPCVCQSSLVLIYVNFYVSFSSSFNLSIRD